MQVLILWKLSARMRTETRVVLPQVNHCQRLLQTHQQDEEKTLCHSPQKDWNVWKSDSWPCKFKSCEAINSSFLRPSFQYSEEQDPEQINVLRKLGQSSTVSKQERDLPPGCTPLLQPTGFCSQDPLSCRTLWTLSSFLWPVLPQTPANYIAQNTPAGRTDE